MTDSAKTEITNRHKAIEDLINSSPFNSGDKEYSDTEYRTKLLVLTDLFVEKDIKALEQRAEKLNKTGYYFSIIVFIIFTLAASIAFIQLFDIWNLNTLKNLYNLDQVNNVIVVSWTALIPTFIKSFTFYGLLILLGVTIWKHAKANFDQAERLLSKRRSDRLLRLYIHLHKGDISIKDLKALLSFSDSKNAFTDIKTEAKAPWGNVISDLIKANTEIAKAVGKNIKSSTKHGDK